MLSVIRVRLGLGVLFIIMLRVVMLIIVMLSAVAPF